VDEHPKQNHTRIKQTKPHFTPLTERRTQILKEICHTRLHKFPQEPEGKVLGRNKDEWCDFHHTRGHSTEACWTLRTQLEQLAQEGRLSRYIQNTSRNPRDVEVERQNQRRTDRNDRRRSRSRLRDNIPRHHSNDLRGSCECQPDRAQNNGGDRMSNRIDQSKYHASGKKADNPPVQDEPMVISVVAAEYKVERVLIDQGSSANILYWFVF
ncbi:hypothetical protein CR513_20782, partial [Mucuna pruriens]